MGGCQNYGPFLGTLNIRCHSNRDPKGDHNFDNHPCSCCRTQMSVTVPRVVTAGVAAAVASEDPGFSLMGCAVASALGASISGHCRSEFSW